MARKLRVEYPGAIYHVVNRGDRREPIFKDDQDRRRFLETLGEACAKTGWQVHAYVLMSNHFHLVLETPGANLVAGMKWFLGTYTARFNRRHRVSGHLFSGRYKSLIVDGSSGGYFRTVCDYVHLNPVRARLLQPDEPLKHFAWSSWPAHLSAPAQRPAWLRGDRLLGVYRIPKDSPAGRRMLEQELETRREGGETGDFKPLRKGWCLGDETFRKELLEQMSGGMGKHHGGSARRETEEAHAEGIVDRELARRQWDEAELERRTKGDVSKAAIARRLRTETTMTLQWIAQRLRMGSGSMVTHCLRKVPAA